MPARDFWRSPTDPGLITLNQLTLWTRSEGDAPALVARRNGGWQPLSGREFYHRVRALACHLGAAAAPGARIAILAESRPEWLVADAACLAAGLVDVPVYPTLTGEQVAGILRHSGACGLFVSSPAQAGKLRPLLGGLAALRWLCCFDGNCGGLPIAEFAWEAWQTPSADAEADDAFELRLRATPPDRIATLLYTSGTTGEPKGVVLTHANMCANLNLSTLGFNIRPGESRLSILPLSHITERHIAYADRMHSAVTYFAESLETVARDLLQTRPHALVAVPRLFEKVAAGIEAEVLRKPAPVRRVFAWARGVGRRMVGCWLAGWPTPGAPPPLRPLPRALRPPLGLRIRAALAERLVYAKVRAKLGGRLYRIISGGAPLAVDVAEMLLSLGVVIDQGYGLTETSPVIAVNRPGERRLGSVGRPLANVQVQIAGDGELLVRGPSVFAGYYNDPEATAAALAGGWFHTGDIVRQDEDGFLFITDRKKDLIKTSGGKFIAPQPIEARLKRSPYILEAVVVGDGRHYASALLVPNFAALEAWAAARALPCHGAAGLCRDPVIQQLLEGEVAAVNAGLARFETIKRFTLLEHEFSIESGELTPTVKVRRRSVEDKYRALIDRMYAEPRT